MKYCLIGKTLSHSYSEVLHRSYGLDYSLVELKSDELCSFVKDPQFCGFNVTIPYKKDIIAFLDEVSPLAERIGAVNTVLKKDGKLFGYNTDYRGFTGAFSFAGVSVSGKNVLVLGSGGASMMAQTALEDMGAKSVNVVSRSGKIDYSNCYDLTDTQIIVNATPVGTYPDITASPIELERFKKLEFVFDLIYNPNKTALIREAERLGLSYTNGLVMLVIQALCAREIWTGKGFCDDDIKKCLSVLNDRSLNIAIIGMPSSGKSTVGRAIAEILGKRFFDTDEEFSIETGRTPEDVITKDGEAAFRDMEERVVEKTFKNRGAVIALGGGSILRQKNVDILKATAFTVWIKRDLSLLTDESRPTLKREGAKKMYEKRAPIYEKTCDKVVYNDGEVRSAAEEVIKAYENFGR